MRQAYDYWQDQPGIYRLRFSASSDAITRPDLSRLNWSAGCPSTFILFYKNKAGAPAAGVAARDQQVVPCSAPPRLLAFPVRTFPPGAVTRVAEVGLSCPPGLAARPPKVVWVGPGAKPAGAPLPAGTPVVPGPGKTWPRRLALARGRARVAGPRL